MMNPKSGGEPSTLKLISLEELGRDGLLKSSYLEAMSSFYLEDEQAKVEGRAHQGYQERSTAFPLVSLKKDFSRLVDHARRLEEGDGTARVAIRALVDVPAKRVIGETFLRMGNRLGEAPFCDPLSYVRPGDRGSGVGSTLFPLVMHEALSLGCESVRMSARDDNPASWRRFEKLVSAGLAIRVQSVQQEACAPLWRRYEIKPEKWGDAAQILAAREPSRVDFKKKIEQRRSPLGSKKPFKL